MDNNSQAPQTNSGRRLARGWFHDYEDSRETARLSLARQILAGVGATYSIPDHADNCDRRPANVQAVLFGYRDSLVCRSDCPAQRGSWPAWVSGATLDAAYRLADRACRRG